MCVWNGVTGVGESRARQDRALRPRRRDAEGWGGGGQRLAAPSPLPSRPGSLLLACARQRRPGCVSDPPRVQVLCFVPAASGGPKLWVGAALLCAPAPGGRGACVQPLPPVRLRRGGRSGVHVSLIPEISGALVNESYIFFKLRGLFLCSCRELAQTLTLWTIFHKSVLFVFD